MKVLTPLFISLFGVVRVVSQGCTDELRNGNFEAINSDPNSTDIVNWENAPTFFGAVNMTLVPGENGVGNGLRVFNRYAWWASAKQVIDTSCFQMGEQLEFSARIKLEDGDGNPTQCTPGQIWGRFGITTGICPLMTLKTVTAGETAYIDVASLVAPYNTEWNSMYGVYTVSEELLNADEVHLMLYKMEKPMGYTLDDVSIKVIDGGCSTVIKNGGGEAGDARNWNYYGNDGVIHAAEYHPDFTIGTKHLVVKNRQDYDDGIMTLLDTACLDKDSLYTVSAKMKLVRTDPDTGINYLVTCDYLGTAVSGGTLPRCPMIHIGAYNSGGPRQFRPVASVNAPFSGAVGDWNEMSSVFGFFHNELTAEQTFLFINGAPPGTDILIDDVSIVRSASSTYMPSAAPTGVQSDAPSITESAAPSTAAAANTSL